ncbi:MAG TPA: uroporphyrinogen-III C-methyltransferase [Ottowia sp.]|nr:uroporphyrinogen-III C-methyltransferase [Ottowia sp.]HPZ56568.1 uroporphyrinogen-III C-methyltransferase [Ottowia sp.]HQD46875.1 uroporphyrinogen-III C-methyltransferase [Ottowia sp.]
MMPEPTPALPSAHPAPPAPDAGAEPANSATSAARLDATPRPAGLQPGLVVAWLLAAIGLVVSALLWQKVAGMQEQLARQSADAGTQSVEARTLARQAEENARSLSGKVATLETKVADMAAYRTQLDALVQSVARARDENLAVDLDAALRVAQDQTQLTGSVEPLLAALRTAERRLSRSSDPRLAPVARAVTRELEAVKRASIADTAGLLARIDLLLRQADELPVANDVGRDRPGQAPRGGAVAPTPESAWARLWHSALDQAHGLLRVSRVERPEASMLSPEQAFFVRENFKLRLHGARLALLARQYEAVRADLSAASTLLGTWFDPASRRTQSAATTLQQIQAGTKSADLPRIDDTLTALGNVMAAASATGTLESAGGR